MLKPTIRNNPLTIPTDTYHGKPIYGSAPAGAEAIGEDKNGSLWCFVVQREKMRLVGSLANQSTLASTVSYTSEKGSTIGFAEQFGVSVTATAGIDIKVLSASISATVSASMTFTQAFSKMTSHQVTAPAQPNKLTCVYEGAMDITYHALTAIKGPVTDKNGKVTEETQFYVWAEGKTDSIESGAYVVKEFDVINSPPAP